MTTDIYLRIGCLQRMISDAVEIIKVLHTLNMQESVFERDLMNQFTLHMTDRLRAELRTLAHYESGQGLDG